MDSEPRHHTATSTTTTASASATTTMMHVFMVSFPGQGHVNPLLRLAKKLANHGLFVTLSAPQMMAQSIRKSDNNIKEGEPTPYGDGMIQFELFDDGWDMNDPNRDDLDDYMAQLERAGREKLPAMIKEQESKGRPVCCLINNPFIPWASDVAEELGLPSAVLWVQSCASFSAYYHYHNKLVPFPSEDEPKIDVQLPSMPLLKHDEVPSFLHPSSPYAFLAGAILGQFKNLEKPFCVLMDTFEELEHDIIEHMSTLIGRPIRTIGPLFKEFIKKIDSPASNNSCVNNVHRNLRVDLFEADNSIIGWLDKKPSRSVVYISFGSIVHLKQEQVDELAYGLLASEASFLWVLRPPRHENVEPHVLPKGFLEGVGDKGKVVEWSPQEEVLSHPSTACFLTHCGWNSTVEALANGVPVVAFPQWGDQVTNAKFLVDVIGVGVRMCRGAAEGRVVGREEVERCVREATSGNRAEEMRRNAERWRRAAEEALTEETGSSWKNMQGFVDEMVSLGGRLKSEA